MSLRRKSTHFGSGVQFFAVLLCTALSVCPLNTFAQERHDLSEMSLEELMKIDVYAASKRLQNASEAPATVSIVTAEEIRSHGYRTLADILRNVRSFYVTYDRNFFYVGTRGDLRPGDNNTHILVMIDGHRINDEIYYMASVGSDFPLDVDMIERVEIIRGPSSSLYGTNAVSAVVNIITKKASDLNGWELSFSPASFNTYNGRVTYGGTVRDANVLVSGTFSDSAGQTFYIPQFNFPETNNGIFTNGDYERYQDLLATITFGKLTFQGVSGWREKGVPTGLYGTEFNNPHTRNRFLHQYADLSYRTQVGRESQMLMRVSYDRFGYDGTWAYTDNVLNIDRARAQSWGAEFQWDLHWQRKHTLTFGSELRNALQQDQENYDINPAMVYVDDRRSSWMGAGFVQDEYRISSQWTINAGLRYDRYTDFGGSLSPRLALLYRPFPSTSLKLLYGSAFRVPTAFEAYYGGGGNSDFEINPNLKPEITKNIEGVWEQTFGENLRVSTGVFHNRATNLISLETNPQSGLFVFKNSANATITGFEFEIEGHVADRIESRVSYTYVNTGRDEQPFSNFAPHLAKLSLTAPFWKKRLIAGFDGHYESGRNTISGNSMGGFPVFNFTLSSGKAFDHFELSGSIYNLLDRKYLLPVSDETPGGSVLQNGRHARLKLTFHIGGERR